jgi:hypothetical protein
VSANPSPLGRYAPTDVQATKTVTVQLLDVPVRVLVAGREHHDSLMREFRLLALSQSEGAHVPARLAELTQVLGVRYAAARDRPDAVVDAALDRGDATVDLAYELPADPGLTAGLIELDRLMTAADEFCRDRQLLAVERGPVLIEFTRWYLDAFVSQLSGGPPVRWSGPLDP